jgi:hypothetical protein
MSIVAEISALRSMTARDLRERYYQVFGEQSRSNNRDYLWKRIAYALQERAHGGLSERARQRAEELARDEDLRVRGIPIKVPDGPAPTKKAKAQPPAAPTRKRDLRLPPAGEVLKRTLGGVDHEVRVLDDGFQYSGEVYRSLSAVAIKICGKHCNGFAFFGLKKRDGGEQ